MGARTWTKEEEMLVIKYYLQDDGIEYLEQILGRSRAEIISKAYEMDIGLTEKRIEYNPIIPEKDFNMLLTRKCPKCGHMLFYEIGDLYGPTDYFIMHDLSHSFEFEFKEAIKFLEEKTADGEQNAYNNPWPSFLLRFLRVEKKRYSYEDWPGFLLPHNRRKADKKYTKKYTKNPKAIAQNIDLMV